MYQEGTHKMLPVGMTSKIAVGFNISWQVHRSGPEKWRIKMKASFVVYTTFICKKTKEFWQNDYNKKKYNSIEADGLRDTPLNCNSSLPTRNRLSGLHKKNKLQCNSDNFAHSVSFILCIEKMLNYISMQHRSPIAGYQNLTAQHN